ncbi:MAG: methionyl-tRNA formyltransferase [Vulcanimicrobiaceae bacterium]
MRHPRFRSAIVLTSIFFGTSDFALPSLRVVAQRTQCLCVITQPDRPAGRGHRLQPSPVKAEAVALGLRVETPEKIGAFIAEFPGEIDLFALASFGRILPQRVLDRPRLGALNVHPSLLPKYRGATPLQSALMNGDEVTGVSIMLMDAGMDTGDLVRQERFPIAPDDDYGSLHDRLAIEGARMLGTVIDEARSGHLERSPQRGEASVTRPFRKDDLLLHAEWSAERKGHFVRALSPQPAARTTLAGVPVKVLRAHVAGDEFLIDEIIAPNRGRMSVASIFDSQSGASA